MNDALYHLSFTLWLLGTWQLYPYLLTILFHRRDLQHPTVTATQWADFTIRASQTDRVNIRRITQAMVIIEPREDVHA